jgi:hypothetical protein
MPQSLTAPTVWPAQPFGPVTQTQGPVYVWELDETAAFATQVIQFVRTLEDVKDGPANRARTAASLARMVRDARHRTPKRKRPRARTHQQPKLRHVR